MYDPRIETMVTVADEGSFNKAATELGITPVSVMNQINSLEDHIGIKLFQRTTQGITLTKAGRSFYEDAVRIITESNEAIAKARRIQKKEAHVIKIGTSMLRPCQPLMRILSSDEEMSSSFQFRIVPFDDNPAAMEKMLESLGKKIDCIIGPCDSIRWQKKYTIFRLEDQKCCCAVSRKNPLSDKESLSWDDLDGQDFMMVRRGESPVLDSIRDEIEQNHPAIRIIDIPAFYDTDVFNSCDDQGAIMETLPIWNDVHPSLKTLDMDWDYTMPYGLIAAKHPSTAMQKLILCLSSYRNN